MTTFLYYVLVAHAPSPAITLPETLSHTGGNNAEQTFPNPNGDDNDTIRVSIQPPPLPPPPTLPQHQVVGFFSKEKMSWDNNNLACILVFPPWQKQGLGQILMGASYEISKREGRLGGPEKRKPTTPLPQLPTFQLTDFVLNLALSELGRRAYVHYWSQTLARTILAAPAKKTLTVMDLRNETYIVPEDIITTLQFMGVLEHKRKGGADAVINKASVRAWVEAHRVSLENPIDEEGFVGAIRGVGTGDNDEEEEDEDEEMEE